MSGCAASIWNAAFAGAAIGAGSAAINGGNILKGALIGAFSGAAFFKIGQHFKGMHNSNIDSWHAAKSAGDAAGANALMDSFHTFGGLELTSSQIAGQIASHAVTGGIISELNGGKFGHGFVSAGITKGLGGKYLPGGRHLSSSQIARGTAISAVIGGTASALTGGKFSNGARTAAYQYLFNQVQKSLGKKLKEVTRGPIGERNKFAVGDTRTLR